MFFGCVVLCRPLALGNAADAVEILSAGYILGSFKQQDGSPLTSTQKGKTKSRLPLGNLDYRLGRLRLSCTATNELFGRP